MENNTRFREMLDLILQDKNVIILHKDKKVELERIYEDDEGNVIVFMKDK